jgi:hypothetical protein
LFIIFSISEVRRAKYSVFFALFYLFMSAIFNFDWGSTTSSLAKGHPQIKKV